MSDDVVVEDPHVEAPGPPGHGLPDAAEADDAQRGPVDVITQEERRPPGLPPALPHEAVPLNDPPGRRHQQGEGEVGCGVRQHPWRVADGDAPSSALGHADIVEAHGHVAHHFELRSRIQQFGVHLVGQEAEESFNILDPLQKHFPGRGQLPLPHPRLADLPDHLQPLLGDEPSDVDVGFHSSSSFLPTSQISAPWLQVRGT